VDATVSIHNPLTALNGVTDRGANGRAAQCRNWAPSSWYFDV